jgi:putative ABC transport system substrate-binding protein
MLRAVILSAVAGFCLVATAAAADHKIMIATWRGCEDACQGFQDYLTERGVDAEFILRDAGQSKEALSGILAEARAERVDLILSWGTSVTLGIAGTLDQLDDPAFNHDIPEVFMIVADPVGAGIVRSLESTGRANVTGTYNRVPETVNIETIRTYLPGFRRLGLLYNRDEENSILKRDEIAALTDPLGFELIAHEIALDSDGQPQVEAIPQMVRELKAAGIDFLYLGSSSFLRKHRDIVTSAALENEIPVLSPYEDLVRESAALISVAARYYDIGRLAGEQAEKILVDGVSAGELPVARMTNFAIVINLTVAKKLQLFPPIELLQIAETVN